MVKSSLYQNPTEDLATVEKQLAVCHVRFIPDLERKRDYLKKLIALQTPKGKK
jgi:hypothetical protein